MPTYEYSCTKCDHTFEIVQSIRDSALHECPKDKCAQKRWGKGKIKRLIGTGAGLLFKGSGFYTTDYRSEGYQAAAKKESGDAAAKPAGDTTKAASDATKPAADTAKPAADTVKPTPEAKKPSKTEDKSSASGSSKK